MIKNLFWWWCVFLCTCRANLSKSEIAILNIPPYQLQFTLSLLAFLFLCNQIILSWHLELVKVHICILRWRMKFYFKFFISIKKVWRFHSFCSPHRIYELYRICHLIQICTYICMYLIQNSKGFNNIIMVKDRP